MSSLGNTTSPAVRIYQITYLFGLVLGSILYLSVNKLFPPVGLGVSEQFDEGSVVTEGISVTEEDTYPDGKEPETDNKRVTDETKV